jgi:acyl-CoA synthetase (AMP-forming)/AMP-acid ligase II
MTLIQNLSRQADQDFATLPDALAHWAATRGNERAVTFVDYSSDSAVVANSLTWRELDARVTAVAAWCGLRAEPGDRAAVLVDQSVDYVIAFLGALRAGLVAVPVYEPSPLPGFRTRLSGVLADCDPALVLTTRRHADPVGEFLDRNGHTGPMLVAVDIVPPQGEYDLVPPRPESLAYLQYTSGSTRNPAGVMVSHANVAAAAAQTVRVYQGTPGSTVVSWLPLYHDMGLIVGLAAPLMGGLSSILMDPVAFLTRPARWLELMAGAPGPAITVAPDFAYGYTAARTTDADLAGLRLDNVATFGDGSEPIAPSIVESFYTRFAGCGARPSMFRQGYGLAEAVLLVTSSPAGQPPKTRRFDRKLLADGEAVDVAPDAPSASTLVSAGRPVAQLVRIVHPETHQALPDGQVGEIWTSGPNVCLGYWGADEATSAAVFRATLHDSDGAIVAPHPGCDGWLRTGDLGVWRDGDLFVTGRLKDLIIADGRNHYPQDIEFTVEHAHRAIRRHAVAAFSVSGGESEVGAEYAVVVAERSRHATEDLDVAEVTDAVRAAVSGEHGLAVRDVVLLGQNELPRTSSGKVRRAECRAQYVAGSFGGAG